MELQTFWSLSILGRPSLDHAPLSRYCPVCCPVALLQNLCSEPDLYIPAIYLTLISHRHPKPYSSKIEFLPPDSPFLVFLISTNGNPTHFLLQPEIGVHPSLLSPTGAPTQSVTKSCQFDFLSTRRLIHTAHPPCYHPSQAQRSPLGCSNGLPSYFHSWTPSLNKNPERHFKTTNRSMLQLCLIHWPPIIGRWVQCSCIDKILLGLASASLFI